MEEVQRIYTTKKIGREEAEGKEKKKEKEGEGRRERMEYGENGKMFSSHCDDRAKCRRRSECGFGYCTGKRTK